MSFNPYSSSDSSSPMISTGTATTLASTATPLTSTSTSIASAVAPKPAATPTAIFSAAGMTPPSTSGSAGSATAAIAAASTSSFIAVDTDTIKENVEGGIQATSQDALNKKAAFQNKVYGPLLEPKTICVSFKLNLDKYEGYARALAFIAPANATLFDHPAWSFGFNLFVKAPSTNPSGKQNGEPVSKESGAILWWDGKPFYKYKDAVVPSNCQLSTSDNLKTSSVILWPYIPHENSYVTQNFTSHLVYVEKKQNISKDQNAEGYFEVEQGHSYLLNITFAEGSTIAREVAEKQYTPRIFLRNVLGPDKKSQYSNQITLSLLPSTTIWAKTANSPTVHELKQALNAIEKLNEENEKLKKLYKDAIQKAKTAVDAANEQEKQKISDLQNKLLQLENEKEAHKQKSDNIRKHSADLEKREQKISKELSELREKLKSNEIIMAKLIEERGNLIKEKEDIEITLQEKEQQLLNLHEKVVPELTQERDNLKKEIQNIEKELKEKKGLAETLVKERDDAQQKCIVLNGHQMQQQARLTHQQQLLAAEKDARAKAEEALSQKQQAVQEVVCTITQAQEDYKLKIKNLEQSLQHTNACFEAEQQKNAVLNRILKAIQDKQAQLDAEARSEKLHFQTQIQNHQIKLGERAAEIVNLTDIIRAYKTKEAAIAELENTRKKTHDTERHLLQLQVDKLTAEKMSHELQIKEQANEITSLKNLMSAHKANEAAIIAEATQKKDAELQQLRKYFEETLAKQQQEIEVLKLRNHAVQSSYRTETATASSSSGYISLSHNVQNSIIGAASGTARPIAMPYVAETHAIQYVPLPLQLQPVPNSNSYVVLPIAATSAAAMQQGSMLEQGTSGTQGPCSTDACAIPLLPLQPTLANPKDLSSPPMLYQYNNNPVPYDSIQQDVVSYQDIQQSLSPK